MSLASGWPPPQIDDNAFDTAEQLLNDCPPRLRNWEWGRLRFSRRKACAIFRRCAGRLGGLRSTTASDSSPAVGTARPASGISPPAKRCSRFPTAGCMSMPSRFRPTANLIATGGSDKKGYVKIWNAKPARSCKRSSGHTDDVLSRRLLARRPALLTASYDKTARLWDVATGQASCSAILGHNWWVWSAAFSPDESQIVTASQDGTAIVWVDRDRQGGPAVHRPRRPGLRRRVFARRQIGRLRRLRQSRVDLGAGRGAAVRLSGGGRRRHESAAASFAPWKGTPARSTPSRFSRQRQSWCSAAATTTRSSSGISPAAS